jgi:hypothetical protein
MMTSLFCKKTQIQFEIQMKGYEWPWIANGQNVEMNARPD